MKIGILIDEILPGGVQKAAIEEARHLKELGYQSELVAIRKNYDKGYRYEDLIGEMPVEFLSKEFTILNNTFKIPGFNFFSTYHILGSIVAPFSKLFNKFDIVVSHGLFSSAAIWSSSIYKGIPYVTFVWDPASYLINRVYSKKFLFGKSLLLYAAMLLEKTVLERAELVLTASHVHLRVLKNDYGIKKEKIRVIYPGCYPAEKIPENRGDHILSFTRWDKGKNPHFFIELMKRLRHAKLMLAGEWTSKPDLQNFVHSAKKEGVYDRIIMLQGYNKSDIYALCAKARVWVYPNFEAFGMAALEAAASGCPIIMPEGSGVTEIFSHGIHGFFPKEGDVDAYIGYIDELLSNERLAWTMGYKAWERAKSYTWENHSRKLSEALQGVFSTWKR